MTLDLEKLEALAKAADDARSIYMALPLDDDDILRGSKWTIDRMNYNAAHDAYTKAALEAFPALIAKVRDLEAEVKHSAWLHLSFTIHRYLMSCAKGRWDGAEKATRHRELCEYYVMINKRKQPHSLVSKDRGSLYLKIHDTTAEELTNHLPETIGFPVDEDRPDYDVLAVKFFDKFHDIARRTLKGTP